MSRLICRLIGLPYSHPRLGCACVLKKLCLASSILCVMFMLNIIYHIKKDKCSNEESRAMLKKVCDDFESRKVAGALCERLCGTDHFIYKQCFNYIRGKHVIMVSEGAKLLVLKATKFEIDDYTTLSFEGSHFPSVDVFYNIMSNTLKYQFDISLDLYARTKDVDLSKVGQVFINEMWNNFNFEKFIQNHPTGKHKVTAMHSISALLEQDEYITLQSFQHNEFFPHIFGSCGHVYAVEFVPPGVSLSPSLISTAPSWKERANVALGLLKLDESFSNLGKLYGYMHLCDVKGENFGVTDEGIVKAIDVDMAFADKKLLNIFSETKCSKHEDCDFFDCWGWCDVDSRKCLPVRRNNNLQAICKKILTSNAQNGFKGLLRGPPKEIASQMRRILEECISPSHGDEMTSFVANDYLANKLKTIIIDGIKV